MMGDDREVVADQDVGERRARRAARCSRFRTSAWIETSSAEVGSSSSRIAARGSARGRWRRAGAGRRRAGADSGSGSAAAEADLVAARGAMRASASPMPWIASGSASASVDRLAWDAASRRGPGTPSARARWNALSRRLALRRAVDRRSCRSSRGLRPASARSTVDLPEPDSPTMPKLSPARDARSDDVAHGMRSSPKRDVEILDARLPVMTSLMPATPDRASASAARPAAGRARAGSRAGRACRGAARRCESSAAGSVSITWPAYITSTRSQNDAHQVQVVADEDQAHAALGDQVVEDRQHLQSAR